MIILIYLLLMSPFVHAGWRFHKQYDQTSIYHGPQGSRLVVEKQRTAPKEKVFNKKLLSQLEKKKARLLKLTGVKDWQVEERKIDKIKGTRLNRVEETVLPTTPPANQPRGHDIRAMCAYLQGRVSMGDQRFNELQALQVCQ